MTAAAVRLPGVDFTREARAQAPSPLRSDVAGFAGRTRRGPVGERVRVEGWQDYLRRFGGLAPDTLLPYCIRAYFENGGEVAHVVRVGDAKAATAATATWNLPMAAARGATRLAFGQYEVRAASPGAWANRTRVHARYRRRGRSGLAELDLAVEAPGEPPEYLTGLVLGPPGDDGIDPLQGQVERRSALLRLHPRGASVQAAATGPSQLAWQSRLQDGQDALGEATHSYAAALRQLEDEPEVALLALPDLYHDLAQGLAAPTLASLLADARPLLAQLLERVDACRDRLLLLDAPFDPATGAAVGSEALLAWLRSLRGDPPVLAARSGAAYHPWLHVSDPLGGIVNPLKAVPPSGHVAGVISRLDRERGPHYTPANAPVLDAVDLSTPLEGDDPGQLNAQAVNLVRCSPGQGLMLWGSSTLARTPPAVAQGEAPRSDHFIACRRLVHRLVRAIRRVAEPLVFDTNGPELWLAFVRAVTTVLLEAYRGGGLKGARPDEAFYVRCDDTTNPPEQRELGRCICEIGIAPVAPMEFIVIRVALGGEAPLEVFES
jgi:hypothetical protein